VKLTTIENILLAVVRALVALVLLITNYMQRRLRDLMLYTRLNPYLQKDKKFDCFEKEYAVQQILGVWEEKNNRTVANDRRAFEATKWGQQVIRSNPDRHLYAVLYPTRKENLERIANVLRAMDAEAFSRVMYNAKKPRCGKH
jgi:hypothetical protein